MYLQDNWEGDFSDLSMYNATSSGSKPYRESSLDSKYTVADILSSMANGDPLTPTYSGANFISGIVTGTTPTLTPTTLANLEQSFIELTNVPSTVNRNSTSDINTQSGFVPPVVAPVTTIAPMVKQEYVDYEYTDDRSDLDWEPSGKRPRMMQTSYSPAPSRGATPSAMPINYSNTPTTVTTTRKVSGPRRSRNEHLEPEEEQRRSVRRDRNKKAAAKCRQRRVDLTNTLINETEGLEDEQSNLENDIQSLQAQKEQLEFLLQAHKPVCQKKLAGNNSNLVKSERPVCSLPHGASAVPSSTPAIHYITPDNYNTTITTITSRPNSLPIPARTITSVTEATGVSITTPSNGVLFNFGLDSMVDGHTGLTPITGHSCASQIQRNSSDSSPETLSSPTLMAL